MNTNDRIVTARCEADGCAKGIHMYEPNASMTPAWCMRLQPKWHGWYVDATTTLCPSHAPEGWTPRPWDHGVEWMTADPPKFLYDTQGPVAS